MDQRQNWEFYCDDVISPFTHCSEGATICPSPPPLCAVLSSHQVHPTISLISVLMCHSTAVSDTFAHTVFLSFRNTIFFFPPSILHGYFSLFFFFHFSAFSGCCSHPRILSPVFSLSIALSSWIISSHCFTCSQYRENVLISVLSLTPICLFSEHLCPDHFVDPSNSVSLSPWLKPDPKFQSQTN